MQKKKTRKARMAKSTKMVPFTTSTNLVVTESVEVLPDWVEVGDTSGLEQLDPNYHVKPPVIKLAQKTSPELAETNPKFIKGLEFGDLFNSITGEIYGRGPLYFSVIRTQKPRAMEFIPMEQGGGVKDRDVPLDDPRLLWDDVAPGGHPIATLILDFVVLLWPTRERACLSFKSSGIKAAESLGGKMVSRRHPKDGVSPVPAYLGRYTLQSKVEPAKKGGEYAIYKIDNDAFLNEDDSKYSKYQHDLLKDQTVTVEVEGDDL